MVMWIAILLVAIAGAVAGVVFLWTRFQKFGFVQKLAGGRTWRRRLLALLPLAFFGVFAWLDTVNTVIVLVHMAAYWAIAELIAWGIRRIRGGRDPRKDQAHKAFRPYWVGVIVLCIEVCYFTTGWYLDHHVWETDYQLTTAKDLGRKELRIAQVTDSHVGATFDGEGFARHMARIQKTHPDILVITGDYVDDGTSREDMLRCCQALKEFDAPLGKYFIYGNHDKGYYNYRNFSWRELESELTEHAGVEVLEDEAVLVDDRFYIVGRKDRSDPSREEAGNLISPLDPSRYILMLDHQPNDFAAEAATAADLVLCGHTHGGQMIFIDLASKLMRANDRNYGMETRKGTTFLVSSGISDWAIKFKTGTRSEFCIIDVQGKQK